MTAVEVFYGSLLAATVIVYPLAWYLGPNLPLVCLLVGLPYICLRLWSKRQHHDHP